MDVKNRWDLDDSQDKESFYEKDFIDDCRDDDMISNEEVGFMQGYLGAG